MTEPEGFLARWSRRKREVAETAPAPVADRDAAQAPAPTAINEKPDVQSTPAATTETLVDVTKLPPIESITAATDIRAFLAPGVPVELTRAALRRAWAADPAIRDFIGLAENQWDFTAPGGAPGFGPAPDAEQIRQLLARIIGSDEPGPGASSQPEPQATGQLSDSRGPQSSLSAITAAGEESLDPGSLAPATSGPPEVPMLRRNNRSDEPSQEQADEEAPPRPRHGRALPT